jgi:hypothetical protein|tara:strand:+ start:365 stop:532 length:168 start_codon:yes stop_codon:yes gene_type:complete
VKLSALLPSASADSDSDSPSDADPDDDVETQLQQAEALVEELKRKKARLPSARRQ